MAIIILITVIFNGYKLTIYNEFKDYLVEKYPDKSFDLHWVKYDFIYGNHFFATVYCNNDGTKFSIHKQNVISEEYLLTKNREEMNRVINSYFENEDVKRYIEHLNVSSYKNDLNTGEEIDYPKIVDRIYVYYYDNSIKDNNQFAEISYNIVHILKDNNVDFNVSYFTDERDSKVYELQLMGRDINEKAEEIIKLIRRRK